VCDTSESIWEGVVGVISLDRVDVDNDIYIFLEQSFRKPPV
jgi:hypothetical protein